MKKLLIFLSLLITANAITTSACADYSEQIVPALKIAGGTLAAATAVAYAGIASTGLITEFTEKNKPFPGTVGSLIAFAATPACIAATILSAMSFGLTKDITVNPAIKIAGGAFMGLFTIAYLHTMKLLNANHTSQEGTLVAGPAAICTATLAALAFKSAAQDLLGK